ncbi:hypothetical protein CISIN_1g039832mg [Citrus sinensis]|uniref:Uncharacterized protein n=1 Tax=Citrus sinensis TaxID=2711 RepID=A0A067HDI7_CITSI|nr:hypothetical protein CISIN_1g039832mg [Citrus sinensis]
MTIFLCTNHNICTMSLCTQGTKIGCFTNLSIRHEDFHFLSLNNNQHQMVSLRRIRSIPDIKATVRV